MFKIKINELYFRIETAFDLKKIKKENETE